MGSLVYRWFKDVQGGSVHCTSSYQTFTEKDLRTTQVYQVSASVRADACGCPADAGDPCEGPLRMPKTQKKWPRMHFPAFEKYKVLSTVISNPPCGCPMGCVAHCMRGRGFAFFFCGRRPLSFGGSHLRLPSGPAGIRTTTGSLSALARPTPYQLSHRVAWGKGGLLPFPPLPSVTPSC